MGMANYKSEMHSRSTILVTESSHHCGGVGGTGRSNFPGGRAEFAFAGSIP